VVSVEHYDTKRHRRHISCNAQKLFEGVGKAEGIGVGYFYTMPPSERDAWVKTHNEQANRIFQLLLEDAEKKSPVFAARLDDRGPKELEGLEHPLE
jgi:hypothetical protein